jgi:hypothetical protein
MSVKGVTFSGIESECGGVFTNHCNIHEVKDLEYLYRYKKEDLSKIGRREVSRIGGGIGSDLARVRGGIAS